jgi:hypothetical protein
LRGLAVHAPATADRDPIFTAINAHRQAVMKSQTEHGNLVVAGGPEVSDWRPATDALTAELAAGKALIDTAPTTLAGLRALEVYLRNDQIRSIRRFIERPLS